MTNVNHSIEVLKSESEKHPASKAVFTGWASRRRARGNVTLKALAQKMEAQGFKADPADFIPALEAMAKAGFGTLVKDSKGRVKGLKDIKIKLMDIGKAVLGEKVEVSTFKQKNRFIRLPKAPVLVDKPKAEAKGPDAFLMRRATDVASDNTPVSLTVRINQKPISIPLPKNLSSEEVAAIVAKFQIA